ncbi:MAG: ribonuclease H family protein [Lachnospiraceae bacterium]|nr:ribonuclease H family protein [Lachnospiraceae bacterium]
MAVKFYAVRNGRVPGIYETWPECETQVKGYPGAVYKSFKQKNEAEAFLEGISLGEGESLKSASSKAAFSKNASSKNAVSKLSAFDASSQTAAGINDEVEDRIAALKEGELIAFVDGSYDAANVTSGFGAVMIDASGATRELSGSFSIKDGEDFMSMRNVTAELMGIRAAVNFALSSSCKRLTVYYDYEGIGRWADGSWQAKKELTQSYRDFIMEAKENLEIELIKVPAHTGVIYNEMVDKLAKEAAFAAVSDAD